MQWVGRFLHLLFSLSERAKSTEDPSNTKLQIIRAPKEILEHVVIDAVRHLIQTEEVGPPDAFLGAI